MRSYSNLNLLSEALGFSKTKGKGLMKYLTAGKRYITVSIPYYDYIRGQVFVDDLHENYGDDLPLTFNINYLIYMLYDDFLTQIKHGAKNEQIASYLTNGYYKYCKKKTNTNRVVKSLNSYKFESFEKEDNSDLFAHLTIRMKESEILRAEILIHDLEPYLNKVEILTEDIIAIVYLDFIHTVKAEGNSQTIQKSILKYLNQFD